MGRTKTEGKGRDLTKPNDQRLDAKRFTRTKGSTPENSKPSPRDPKQPKELKGANGRKRWNGKGRNPNALKDTMDATPQELSRDTK